MAPFGVSPVGVAIQGITWEQIGSYAGAGTISVTTGAARSGKLVVVAASLGSNSSCAYTAGAWNVGSGASHGSGSGPLSSMITTSTEQVISPLSLTFSTSGFPLTNSSAGVILGGVKNPVPVEKYGAVSPLASIAFTVNIPPGGIGVLLVNNSTNFQNTLISGPGQLLLYKAVAATNNFALWVFPGGPNGYSGPCSVQLGPNGMNQGISSATMLIFR